MTAENINELIENVQVIKIDFPTVNFYHGAMHITALYSEHFIPTVFDVVGCSKEEYELFIKSTHISKYGDKLVYKIG
jgi:hypothetical protein